MSSYYEILNVPRNASIPEIAASYRMLIQQSYHEQGREADFSSLSQAYKTLTNPSKRQEYDRKLNVLAGQYQIKDPESPTEAEKCYLDGLTAFERQNYQGALQYFAKAARLEPTQGHFFSQWGLSIGMFPGRLPEAELYCKKAIEQDPDNPEFYYNLGFLYQRHNLGEAAQQAFLKAQEAQQVRQTRQWAEESAAIEVPWEGDADSLLAELDTLEQVVDTATTETPQAQAIALPPQNESNAEEAVYSEPGMGAHDLLKELDSLETSINGIEEQQAQAAGEVEVAAESMMEETVSETGKQPEANQLAPPPEDDRISSAESEDNAESHATMDLLKELDSIESMVNGTRSLSVEQSAEVSEEPHPVLVEGVSPAPEEPVLAEMEQVSQESSEPHPLDLPKDEEPGVNADDLEQEALKLLQELNVSFEDHPEVGHHSEVQEQIISTAQETPDAPTDSMEPVNDEISEPVSEPAVEPQPVPSDEAAGNKKEIKQKLDRLGQMEEQMMEELMKLKAERERLKADLNM
jgi:hypothetical protein